MSNSLGFRNGVFQSGLIIADSQPDFFAYKSSPTANATGDGTSVILICDTQIYNVSSSYNVSNGIFTAPRDGNYSFCANIYLNNLNSSHARGGCWFISTKRNVYGSFANYATMRDSLDNLMINMSCELDMAEGDTCKVNVAVFDDTKTVTIFGQANSDQLCWFSGHLLPS